MTPSSSSLDLFLALRGTASAIEKEAEKILVREIGLTFCQWTVLSTLLEYPSCCQRHVAACRNQTEAAVSRQIETLEQKRLLSCNCNVLNRREHVLTLTPGGKKKAGKGRKILETLCEELFSELSGSRRRDLLNACECCRDSEGS